MWLFALMAHDGLSNVPPMLWGGPLVFALLSFVCFTAHACYKDFADLKAGLAAEEVDKTGTGNELDEAEPATDGADASSPEEEAWASTEEAGAGAEAGAHKQDEEDARAAEPSNVDFAIDVMLCNYRDEADVNGKSASADAAPTSEPPPPEAEDEARDEALLF